MAGASGAGREDPRERLRRRVAALPPEPGVYLLRGARGRVLYVGKAANLRSRVRSYLSASGDGRPQMPHLVERVAEVEVVVTRSVKEALLLENELIKRHRPRFNVRLRDDKQYLALRLDPREAWPRLTSVRRFARDGALYFGPYDSSQAMREATRNLRRIFPLRSCSDAVMRDYARRGRPCLEYQLRRCAAPCCGRVDEAAYRELVQGTVLFLRGRPGDLLRELRSRMERAAEELRFEEAARLRDRIAAVERTLERQPIVGDPGVERDVFGLAREGGEVYVQGLHVREGRVVASTGFAFSDVRVDDGEVVGAFLSQYYAGGSPRPVPGEVVVREAPPGDQGVEELLRELRGRAVRLRTPRRGTGRELLELAERNAELALRARLAARESLEGALRELAEAVGLPEPPRRIECYDVSNVAGVLAVASRVVFEQGEPVPAAWRRYRIRSAEPGDDYACLREVFRRRLARREEDPLPDLLVVDGGRGQLGVVCAVLRDAGLEVPALGLAKEREGEGREARVRRSGGLKAERIFLPGRRNPVRLPPTSRALLLLQRVRDESHRFAIGFQRELRRKAQRVSVLEEIPGIGPRKRRALLRTLGSLRAVREADVGTLRGVPGISAADAERVRRFLGALDQPAEELPCSGDAVSAAVPGDEEGAGVS